MSQFREEEYESICKPLSKRSDFEKSYIKRGNIEEQLLGATKSCIKYQDRIGIMSVTGFDGVGKSTTANKILNDLESSILTVKIDVDPDIILEQDLVRWLLTNLVDSILRNEGDASKYQALLQKSQSQLMDIGKDAVQIILGLTSPWIGLTVALIQLIQTLQMERKSQADLPSAKYVYDIITKCKSELHGLKEDGIDGILIKIDDISMINSSVRIQLLSLLQEFVTALNTQKEVYATIAFLLVWREVDSTVSKLYTTMTQEEETFLEKHTIRFRINPFSELDDISRLLAYMGIGFESTEVLEIIKRKTQGRPRKICIVANWLASKFNVRALTLDMVNQIPDSYADIVIMYVHEKLSPYEDALLATSIFPYFDEPLLVRLLSTYLKADEQSGKIISAAKVFVRCWLVSRIVGSPSMYTINSDYLWLVEAVKDLILNERLKAELHKISFEYYNTYLDLPFVYLTITHGVQVMKYLEKDPEFLTQAQRDSMLKLLLDKHIFVCYNDNSVNGKLTSAKEAYAISKMISDYPLALKAAFKLFECDPSYLMDIDVNTIFDEVSKMYSIIENKSAEARKYFALISLNYSKYLISAGRTADGLEINIKAAALIGTDYFDRGIVDRLHWVESAIHASSLTFNLAVRLSRLDIAEAQLEFSDTVLLMLVSDAELCKRAGQLYLLRLAGTAEFYRAYLLVVRGKFEEGLRHQAHCLELTRRLDSRYSYQLQLFHKYIQLLLKMYDNSHRDLIDLFDDFYKIEDKVLTAQVSILLAVNCLGLGKNEEVTKYISIAESIAKEFDKKVDILQCQLIKIYSDMLTMYYAIPTNPQLVSELFHRINVTRHSMSHLNGQSLQAAIIAIEMVSGVLDCLCGNGTTKALENRILQVLTDLKENDVIQRIVSDFLSELRHSDILNLSLLQRHVNILGAYPFI